jgi:hypothetical protein
MIKNDRHEELDSEHTNMAVDLVNRVITDTGINSLRD